MSSLSRYALLVAVGAAVFGIAVYFISILKTAQAREVAAACNGLAPTAKSRTFDVPFPTAAKEFTAQDRSGNMVHLSDYRGKVVLVNFWASWCKTCAAEKPSLNAFQEKVASDDVVVLALASDKSWSSVDRRLQHGSPLHVLLDPPQGDSNFGPVATAYGITAVPETFIVDKKGVVRYYIVNKRDWTSGIANTCIEALARE